MVHGSFPGFGVTAILLAGLWLCACNTPNALCSDIMGQLETCDSEELEPDDQQAFMEECVEEFEDGENEGEVCYEALTALASCIGGLSCDDWDLYWDGDPGEDSGYPCHAEDQAIYVDDVCG